LEFTNAKIQGDPTRDSKQKNKSLEFTNAKIIIKLSAWSE